MVQSFAGPVEAVPASQNSVRSKCPPGLLLQHVSDEASEAAEHESSNCDAGAAQIETPEEGSGSSARAEVVAEAVADTEVVVAGTEVVVGAVEIEVVVATAELVVEATEMEVVVGVTGTTDDETEVVTTAEMEVVILVADAVLEACREKGEKDRANDVRLVVWSHTWGTRGRERWADRCRARRGDRRARVARRVSSTV
jgi:hypothetical protein